MGKNFKLWPRLKRRKGNGRQSSELNGTDDLINEQAKHVSNKQIISNWKDWKMDPKYDKPAYKRV